MLGPKCPRLERDEDITIQDKDIDFINNNRKKEFSFWLKEKGY